MKVIYTDEALENLDGIFAFIATRLTTRLYPRRLRSGSAQWSRGSARGRRVQKRSPSGQVCVSCRSFDTRTKFLTGSRPMQWRYCTSTMRRGGHRGKGNDKPVGEKSEKNLVSCNCREKGHERDSPQCGVTGYSRIAKGPASAKAERGKPIGGSVLRGAYFTRFHVASAFVPVDVLGLVYFSSSAVSDAINRF
jgi:hypothetical protein